MNYRLLVKPVCRSVKTKLPNIIRLMINDIVSCRLTAIKLVRSADFSPQNESGLKSVLRTFFCYYNQADMI